MKYESPTSSGKKAMAKVKVFLKVGQTSRSRSLGQKVLVPMERSCHKECPYEI